MLSLVCRLASIENVSRRRLSASHGIMIGAQLSRGKKITQGCCNYFLFDFNVRHMTASADKGAGDKKVPLIRD